MYCDRPGHCLNGTTCHDFVELVEVQRFQRKQEGENSVQMKHAKSGFIPVLTRYIGASSIIFCTRFPQEYDIYGTSSMSTTGGYYVSY